MVKIKLFSLLSEKYGYIILVNKRVASLDIKINDADEIWILPYAEGS